MGVALMFLPIVSVGLPALLVGVPLAAWHWVPGRAVLAVEIVVLLATAALMAAALQSLTGPPSVERLSVAAVCALDAAGVLIAVRWIVVRTSGSSRRLTPLSGGPRTTEARPGPRPRGRGPGATIGEWSSPC